MLAQNFLGGTEENNEEPQVGRVCICAEIRLGQTLPPPLEKNPYCALLIIHLSCCLGALPISITAHFYVSWISCRVTMKLETEHWGLVVSTPSSCSESLVFKSRPGNWLWLPMVLMVLPHFIQIYATVPELRTRPLFFHIFRNLLFTRHPNIQWYCYWRLRQ
jgi:hypothetical protein